MIAVAMDSPQRGFRTELYKEYKAHRPPVPPDLQPQIARMQEVIDAYRLPVLRADGLEADDLIASRGQARVRTGHVGRDREQRQGPDAARGRARVDARHDEERA